MMRRDMLKISAAGNPAKSVRYAISSGLLLTSTAVAVALCEWHSRLHPADCIVAISNLQKRDCAASVALIAGNARPNL
jgi:hypothetical protein